MKILVTGSFGVVGSCLTDILRKRGHEVFGLDLFHALGETGFEHSMTPGILFRGNYARCDIADFRQLERVFQKFVPDFVYNCAAEFGRWNGEDYYEQLWRTNAIGTKNIIRLQEIMRFKLVHFSSSEVYGDYDGVMKESVMETVPIRQLNDYAMSKWVNEMQIKNSQLEHDTQTVIVRLFNTYGPGEYYHPYRSVNSKFCYHALYGLPVTVYTGHFRTSTYLGDTCQTLANIVKNFKPGETYNIGGKTYHSIEDLVNIIWRLTKAPPELVTYRDPEILTTKSKKVNIAKAEKDLKHSLTVPLEEGIKRTLDWMKKVYGK